MTQQQDIVNRKFNILELSEQLGNISEACRKLGISRQHYYDIRRSLQAEGIEVLLEKARITSRFKTG
jgi:molybdenum-dependent DNA-binding transcriptional regulator ModE